MFTGMILFLMAFCLDGCRRKHGTVSAVLLGVLYFAI